MRKYDNYKPTDVGETPSHWEKWKLSHAFKYIGSGTTPESGRSEYYENGSIYWVNTGDLNNSVLNEASKKITKKALADYSALKVFNSGSIAIAMYGATIGKVSLLNFSCTVNQACCVFQESSIITNRFLFYWFLAHQSSIVNLAKGGGQPNISKEILSNLRVYCPLAIEQTKIVTFLDHKTTQIDSLISKKEKLIELLNEERTAMINQAVTKGLNPDVTLKESGIEWLGEIPLRWKCSKLKYHTTKIIDGAHFTPTYIEDESGIPFLRVTDIQETSINLAEVKRIPIQEHLQLIKRCRPCKGDLLLSKNGTIGIMKIIDWDWEFSIFVSLCLMKFEKSLLNRFFMYFFESNVAQQQLFQSSQKTSVSNLHLEKIKELLIPIPNIEEQEEIVSFIELEKERIGKIVLKIQKEIELLKEYKTALISEVVTGKVDVRDEVIADNTAIPA